MRRGRPTLAAKHGLAAALNAGDGLAIVASQVLRRATRRLDRDIADQVMEEFDIMAMRTLEGQAINTRARGELFTLRGTPATPWSRRIACCCAITRWISTW